MKMAARYVLLIRFGLQAEREAFAKERQAIVKERKKGTGVLPSANAEQPSETVRHGRRAGSASSQRSASSQAPWATDN